MITTNRTKDYSYYIRSELESLTRIVEAAIEHKDSGNEEKFIQVVQEISAVSTLVLAYAGVERLPASLDVLNAAINVSNGLTVEGLG